MRSLIAVFAAAATLMTVVSPTAAESDLTITALDCTSHPRRVRVENLGDTAQDLSGWQIQSDPVEGEPLDLSAVGSLDAGQKFFVFQGHQAPPTDPVAGYFRWGEGEIHNLRPNDPTDYVRIVDNQGNTVHQLNCEGLPPGATPAPPSEFDPPPLVVATPTPAPTQAPAATAAPAPTSVRTSAPSGTGSGGTTSGDTTEGGAVPEVAAAGGGPPLAPQSAETLALAAAMAMMTAGALMTTAGIKRRDR